MLTETCRFTLAPIGSGYSVTLSAGGRTATAPFQFDLAPSSRLVGVLDSMRDGVVVYDDLRDIGANLFSGLINGAVGELFASTRQSLERQAAAAVDVSGAMAPAQIELRLDLPAELRVLPWECLYDEARAPGFLLNGSGYSLVRDTPGIEVPPGVPRRQLPVRLLAVIPEGSNLNVDRELHGLNVAVGKLGSAIELSVLDGRVTPDRLRARMREGPWDIVHFIGHGDLVNGIARVRLNDEDPERDDQWVNGEVFASFFHPRPPRLAVLNCCHGGSEAPVRTLSGLGPFLLRAGVPGVVAMQYEIPDMVAIKFAENFYGELLHGTAPGRIDTALASARLSLFQNQTRDRPHAFVTPVLYLVPGHETILELSAVQARTAAAAEAPALALTKLPQDLVDAFRDRRVVPVIGPEVLAIGAVRSAPAPPGPRELARQLAEEAGYPRMEYFRPSDVAGGEAEVWLLPSVCQFYERQQKRYKLLIAVQKIYGTVPPPAAVEEMAGWNVPGFICAYFDGLLEAVMRREHRVFRAVHSVDQKVPGLRDEPLIVHVRGVYSEGDSLVLTERDHELLLDRMGGVSSQVGDLTRKSVGRCLVYVGVSPRDPLVRRLTRALRGNGRNQGPMFFVSDDEASHAYWDDYDVRWLPWKLEEFLAAVGDLGEARV